MVVNRVLYAFNCMYGRHSDVSLITSNCPKMELKYDNCDQWMDDNVVYV